MTKPADSPPAPAPMSRVEAINALDAVLGAAPADTPEPTPEADKGETETGDTGAVDAKAGEGKGGDATPDIPVQAQDLSWAPEAVHTLLAQASPEQIEELKRSVLRHKDYTKKTQAVAAERKEIEAIKEAAEKWRRLESTPEAALAAMRVMDGQAEPEPAAEEEAETDLALLDPKAQRAYLEKVAERKAAEILRREREAKAAEMAKTAGLREAIHATVREWALDAGLTQEQVTAAAEKAEPFAAELGIVVTEKNIVSLLKRFVEATPPASANGNKPTNGAAPRGLASVASPGRNGSSAVSPPLVPKHIQEKRAPKNRAEGVEHARMVLRDQFGLEVSNQGLDEFLANLR